MSLALLAPGGDFRCLYLTPDDLEGLRQAQTPCKMSLNLPKLAG